VLPGDDVKITFPTAGTPPKAVSDTFTIVDFYESKMSEYDSNFVFVPIEQLEKARGMIDPQTGLPSVNSIQIKLRPGADLETVRDRLRQGFPPTCMPSRAGRTSRARCSPPSTWRWPFSTSSCS
jgi:lipoprotein-releasing system permease protein